MRPLHAVPLLGMLFATTACPHAFGKGGSIDRAVLKDMEQSSKPPDVVDCEPATLRRICRPERFADCAQQCEAVLEAQTREQEW